MIRIRRPSNGQRPPKPSLSLAAGLTAPAHEEFNRRMGAFAPPGREALADELLAALLGADHPAAKVAVDRALSVGWSADDIRFELITPALVEVGRRWERGEIGVGLEHLATSLCHWLLIDLAGRTARSPRSGRRAVIGCSEGELHALGALMVANVLSEHGWTVLYLGASTPVDAWAPIVRSRHADVAVLATTMTEGLGRVGPTLRSIRAARPECLTVVGGAAYGTAGEEAADLGADLAAPGPRELPTRLDELARA
jgi:MerR family transcriptional regulator, light-induced transcriptional regulator